MKYAVLRLDVMPKTKYRQFRIDGNLYDPVPVYDMPQCVAIQSEEKFIGKTVEFV